MSHFEEKGTVKIMSKVGHVWIHLAFPGWWSIFQVVVGSGGYILTGGGWCWVVVGGGLV